MVLKVFDFDRVGNDDPMGKAVVDLTALEVEKWVCFTILLAAILDIKCNSSL